MYKCAKAPDENGFIYSFNVDFVFAYPHFHSPGGSVLSRNNYWPQKWKSVCNLSLTFKRGVRMERTGVSRTGTQEQERPMLNWKRRKSAAEKWPEWENISSSDWLVSKYVGDWELNCGSPQNTKKKQPIKPDMVGSEWFTLKCYLSLTGDGGIIRIPGGVVCMFGKSFFRGPYVLVHDLQWT